MKDLNTKKKRNRKKLFSEFKKFFKDAKLSPLDSKVFMYDFSDSGWSYADMNQAKQMILEAEAVAKTKKEDEEYFYIPPALRLQEENRSKNTSK